MLVFHTTQHAVLQASVVPNDPAASSAFARTASSVPLVLTGENTSQQQKLVGIRFGATDFLEKPVALLKLRNVWQHTVRKVRILHSHCLSMFSASVRPLFSFMPLTARSHPLTAFNQDGLWVTFAAHSASIRKCWRSSSTRPPCKQAPGGPHTFATSSRLTPRLHCISRDISYVITVPSSTQRSHCTGSRGVCVCVLGLSAETGSMHHSIRYANILRQQRLQPLTQATFA